MNGRGTKKLNIKTWLKEKPLPNIGVPYSMYIIKDSTNDTYEIKITDPKGAFLSEVSTQTDEGHILFNLLPELP